MKTKKNWDLISEITKAMKKNMIQYRKTGTTPWGHSTAMVDLGYQAGHLLKLKMQLDGERHREGRSKAQLCKLIETELAEVIAISAFIADDLKLDLAAGFQNMLDADKKKIRQRSKSR